MSKAALRARTTLQLLDHDCGVYRLTIGGLVYVGATRQLSRREQAHLTQLHDRMHRSFRLQRAWEAAGQPNDLHFEVLEHTTLERLGERLDAWTADLGATDPARGLNLPGQQTLRPGQTPRRQSRGLPDPDVTPVTQPAVTPRRSQLAALEAALRTLNAAQPGVTARGALTLPCGAGKTILAGLLKAHVGRMLFITHTDDLMEQTIDSMKRVWPGHVIGVIQGREWNPDADIVVASARTLTRRLERLAPEHFDVIIADEAHLWGSEQNTLTLAHFRPRGLFGLSATMYRATGTGLGVLFGEEIYRLGSADAVEEGILCPMKAVLYTPDFQDEDLRTTAGEISNDDELMDTVTLNRYVAQMVYQHSRGGTDQALVFATTIRHAGHLTRALMDVGLNAAVVSGTDPLRKAKVNAFRKGTLQVLVNVNIASYGFDVPEVKVVALAYASNSPVRVQQNAGRASRATPGKTHGLVLDFGGNYHRALHQDLPFDMDMEFIDGGARDARPANVAAVADLSRAGEVAGQERQWRAEHLENAYGELWAQAGPMSANQEQRQLLSQIGYRVALNTTREQARQAIAGAPIQAWQIVKLRELGYVPDPNWSFLHARAALRTIRELN